MMRALPLVLLCGCWDFAGLGSLYAPDGANVGGGAPADLGDDDFALADLANSDLTLVNSDLATANSDLASVAKPDFAGASEIVQHVVCVAGGAHAVGGALGTPGPRVYDFDGASWRGAALAGDGALFALWAGPSGELYAAGYGGAIWRRLPGAAWSALGSPTTEALWGLWGSSSADVFAVGDAGTLVHLP